MRSIVLAAACLACAGRARRVQTTDFQQQVKHIADQMAENGDVVHLRKLATLLLASSSLSAGTHLQADAQKQKKSSVWDLLNPRSGGLLSQAQMKRLQKRGGATAQTQAPTYVDAAWALGDEKGRNFPSPPAGTHSQAEVEFLKKQEKMSGAKTIPNVDHTWGLGDEKGRNAVRGPYAGTHSQAEVEFLLKQKKMAGVQAPPDHSWGLGDEKGRQLARPRAGTHSQAEVEFLKKQEKWRRR